ncbi:MAG TPA: WD40 repeat domain-containing protein, partial [Bryobacterales bacterium]|nr:WD40 repeat domain-containing protein [Bryobacterales bacterium]
MRNMRKLALPRLLAAIGVLWAFGPVTMQASTWVLGDVFVAVDPGQYQVFSNAGVFKETILTGGGGFTTGCAFNPGKTALYGTDFSSRVVVFDATHPHSVIQTISDPGIESVVFTSGGDFFTGGPGKHIIRYNAAGVLQQTYNQSAGSDWVDVSSDQHTLFYDEEGATIHRLDATGSGTQLANFSTAGSRFFALRLLPPGDGSAGLLVANGANVVRLNSSGAIVKTYTAAGAGLFFALNLDPNGTSFWTADLSTGKFYRFNIASGAIEVGPISVGAEAAGLCVLGEPTGAVGGGVGG